MIILFILIIVAICIEGFFKPRFDFSYKSCWLWYNKYPLLKNDKRTYVKLF